VDGWAREWLYWFSEEGERYPVPEEYQRYRADLAEKQVEAERQAREQESLRANQAERLAEQERQAREQERQARAEAEHLAEQERLRAELAERQAHALAERLRALGIDPATL
jgi:membrane protein involved in colicin uptake